MDYDASPLNQALGSIVKGLRTAALDYPDMPINKKLIKEHFAEEIRMLNDKYPKEAAQKKALQDLIAKEGYPDINFGGSLYKVDLPDEQIAKMLDWDKPLSQQSKEIQDALKSLQDDLSAVYSKTAGDAYNYAAKRYGGEMVSKKLREAGIPGIRYLDGSSRKAGEGSSNYVVFPGNEDMLNILERNGQKLKEGS